MLTIAITLSVVVVVTWAIVLSNATNSPSGSVCPSSAAGPDTGTVQPANTLNQVMPSAPSVVRIRVLNGSGQRGQANLVASQLGELGFTEAADPMNDPLYPSGNLTCRGEIRYGPNGLAAARTVRLVLPCVALVRDTRADDTVDIAVGTLFGEVNPPKAARTALQQLVGSTGQTAAGDPTNPAPSVDKDLLTQVDETPC